MRYCDFDWKPSHVQVKEVQDVFYMLDCLDDK